MLDLDGVLLSAGAPVPGAAHAVRQLQSSRYPCAVLTNTTSVGPEVLSARLAEAGIRIPAERIVTAAVATARLVRAEYAGQRVLLVSEEGGERGLRRLPPGRRGPGRPGRRRRPRRELDARSARPRAARAAGRRAPDRHAGQRLVALAGGPAARQRRLRARPGPCRRRAAARDRQARCGHLPHRVRCPRPPAGRVRDGRRRPAQRRPRRSAGGAAGGLRAHRQGRHLRGRPAPRARRRGARQRRRSPGVVATPT